ncbi:AmmeMemoRadiSam system protein B [Psychromonas ossibalaenae]|uniref:AmmeMemoRadiSam system protein B n=1 Tax=Psychromonas ossibalaenae TaxID=444922 RepID=UPI00035E1CB2|nr:AmmeMemoRadiSam system protein B [Psychromonas ossibalaenae]
MKYRGPVVAGSFYPASPEQLNTQLHTFLAVSPEQNLIPHALIVPHAGYCYSGAVAGEAYVYLNAIASEIKRVIVLGPSHRVPLQGCAISNYDVFSTPLGKIHVASDCYKKLLKSALVSFCDSAHLFEHSLEVQLPFLQSCLQDFTIVPIVVGQCPPSLVSDLLNTLEADQPSTLVVVSTDLSHYHSYRQAQLLDSQSIEKILSNDNNLHGQDACGCYAVNGLLDYAAKKGWKIKLTAQANSGDTLGDKQQVVGYASFVLY